MKKRLLAMAVAVAILCSLLPASVIATDVTTGTYVAQIGETKYETLEAAVAEGGEITLLADIDLGTSDIEVSNTVVLDLAGHTISSSYNGAYATIWSSLSGDLTIKDSSSAGTGAITNSAYSAVGTFGKLTIEGGTFTGDYAVAVWDSQQENAPATATLTGGTFQAKEGGYYSVINCGKLTVSGSANIGDYLSSTGDLTVSGGSVEILYLPVIDYSPVSGSATTIEGSAVIDYFYIYTAGNKIEMTGGTITTGIEVDETIEAADLTITGGTFCSDPTTFGSVTEGYKSNEAADGTWFVQAKYVAEVNGVQYGTVAEAIEAADGETVVLLPVVIHEAIKPQAGDSQHVKEKDITIQGVNASVDPNGSEWGTAGETILTGGLYWGYDDGHTRDYIVEVYGITFQGKGLTVADEAKVYISNNKFTDIVGDAITVLDQEYDSMEGYADIEYNRIEGATGTGVNLRNPYTVYMQYNYIANTGLNSITIQKKDGNADNIGNVDICYNTLKNWAYNSTEGRALRAAFAGDATEKFIWFKENKMLRDGDAPEEYVKITGLAEAYYVDLDNNYWNGKNPGETGMVTADNVDSLNWYYADADMQNSVQTYMASVSSNNGDSTYYMTLKEAVDTAQDGNCVYLLRDASGSGIIIDKPINIDFGNYTYTLTEPPVGSSGTETLGFQIKTGNDVTLQNGRLTVDKNYATNYAVLIQNYANLTLTNMNLDGTNLDRHTIKDYDYSYVLSNNSGVVRLDSSTYITANDDGDAYAFDVCKFGSYEAPTVTVDTTGRIIGKIEVTSGLEDNLTIENGTFSANPSAYLSDIKMATLSNGLYYVTDKPEDAPNVSVDVTAKDTATEDVKISEDLELTDDEQTALQEAVTNAVNKEDTKQDLQDAATNLQNDAAVVGDEDAAHSALQEQDAENYDAEVQVEVQVKPYLDVTVKEYDTTNNTVKLDIQALYDVVAVQKNADNEVTASATLQTAQKLENVTTAITITIPLPTGFANDGNTVYIYHTKDDGTLYIHEATVSVADGVTTATFVNDQGFSSFEVKTTKTTELFDFYGANVDLGNTFNMNFYFAKNKVADWTGHYAQFVRKYVDGSTETTTVAATDWVTNNDYWQITYAGINAKEMCDEITVQIFDASGNAVSVAWKDSIQIYASRAFNNPNATAKDFKMIIGMLDFGALAQDYKSYNTLNLANAIVTTAHRNKAEQAD